MKKLIVFIAALGVFASCSSPKIITDSDREANFSNYQSFSIEYLEAEDGKDYINVFNIKRVNKALQNEAVSRGLSEKENADLKIQWGVDVNYRTSYTTHSTYFFDGGYGYGGFGTGYSDMEKHRTSVGIFQIAIIDAATNEVIWIGSASDEIKTKSKDPEARINEIIAKVFEEFPIAKTAV